MQILLVSHSVGANHKERCFTKKTEVAKEKGISVFFNIQKLDGTGRTNWREQEETSEIRQKEICSHTSYEK